MGVGVGWGGKVCCTIHSASTPSLYLKFSAYVFQVFRLTKCSKVTRETNIFVCRKTNMEKFTLVDGVRIYSKKQKKLSIVRLKYNHCVSELTPIFLNADEQREVR